MKVLRSQELGECLQSVKGDEVGVVVAVFYRFPVLLWRAGCHVQAAAKVSDVLLPGGCRGHGSDEQGGPQVELVDDAEGHHRVTCHNPVLDDELVGLVLYLDAGGVVLAPILDGLDAAGWLVLLPRGVLGGLHVDAERVNPCRQADAHPPRVTAAALSAVGLGVGGVAWSALGGCAPEGLGQPDDCVCERFCGGGELDVSVVRLLVAVRTMPRTTSVGVQKALQQCQAVLHIRVEVVLWDELLPSSRAGQSEVRQPCT